MKKLEELKNFLNKFYEDNSGLDYLENPNGYLTNEDLEEILNSEKEERWFSLYNKLDDYGYFNVEIIYHRTALEFLLENDPSLRESINLAKALGFSIEDINSEMLASILKSNELRDIFRDLEEDFNLEFGN